MESSHGTMLRTYDIITCISMTSSLSDIHSQIGSVLSTFIFTVQLLGNLVLFLGLLCRSWKQQKMVASVSLARVHQL